MGELHQLVLRKGREAAKRYVPEGERKLVDIAATVLEEESNALGITYSGFCLTSLPHRRLPDGISWKRQSPKLTLLVEPGQLLDGRGDVKSYGVPYGSRARLILLYLQTEAVRNRSPEVELGRSMRNWLERMGTTTGGKSYIDVRDQASRISACRMTFFWPSGPDDRAIGFSKESIVQSGIQLYDWDDEQPRLWVDTVRLSDSFFNALKKHPVPIWEPAVRHIANQSMAIDIYIWLAYRLRVLEKPTPITWAAAYAQFGAGYKEIRHFRPRFAESLKMALAVYPDAKVDIDDDTGLTLHPSRPPIPEREMAALLA
ncbi:MAG: pirin [Candidatus Hydrogenedens sp.]|nr:pirin [Candidatus Hydrogenedens sp.]